MASKVNIEKAVTPVSHSHARKIGDALGVDWNEVDHEQFRMGLEVEQEHKDVVGDNLHTVGKIALAHLKEMKDYYSRLKKMESGSPVEKALVHGFARTTPSGSVTTVAPHQDSRRTSTDVAQTSVPEGASNPGLGLTPSQSQILGIPPQQEPQVGAQQPQSVVPEPTQSPQELYSQLGPKSPFFKTWFGDWEGEPDNASHVRHEDNTPRQMFPAQGSALIDTGVPQAVGELAKRFPAYHFSDRPSTDAQAEPSTPEKIAPQYRHPLLDHASSLMEGYGMPPVGDEQARLFMQTGNLGTLAPEREGDPVWHSLVDKAQEVTSQPSPSVFLNLRNPFHASRPMGENELLNITKGDAPLMAATQKQTSERTGMPDWTKRVNGLDVLNAFHDLGRTQTIPATLSGLGYDGILHAHPSEDGGEEYRAIAFRPHQIKATQNTGTFDPAEEDIYKAIESEPHPVTQHLRETYPKTSITELPERGDKAMFVFPDGHVVDIGKQEHQQAISIEANAPSEDEDDRAEALDNYLRESGAIRVRAAHFRSGAYYANMNHHNHPTPSQMRQITNLGDLIQHGNGTLNWEIAGPSDTYTGSGLSQYRNRLNSMPVLRKAIEGTPGFAHDLPEEYKKSIIVRRLSPIVIALQKSTHVGPYNNEIAILRDYLQQDFDPYDYSHHVEDYHQFLEDDPHWDNGNIKRTPYNGDEHEWLENSTPDEHKDYKNWLDDQGLRGTGDYHDPPYNTFDLHGFRKPKWLVHFTDSPDDISRDGFKYGHPDYDTGLHLTTWKRNRHKEPGYNFAFDVNSRDASNAAWNHKYGRHAVVFPASSVSAYHGGDNETQEITWGPSVHPKNIHAIHSDENGNWEVRGHNERKLKGDMNFDEAAKWVQDNHPMLQRIKRKTDRERFFKSVSINIVGMNRKPTEAQKEAGNYKKGNVRWHGLNIAIENPKGSYREGTDAKGNKWRNKMVAHYGYIRREMGIDGDPVDVFLGDDRQSPYAFVIDQLTPDGAKFDEHKVMLGFGDEESAKKSYLANYANGWKGLGAITRLTLPSFRAWLRGHGAKEPMSYLQKAVGQQEHIHTPEFKNWFGDWHGTPHAASKVVKQTGEPQETHHLEGHTAASGQAPLKVYHGTSSQPFRAFDSGKDSGENNLYGKGFYFTEDPNVAAEYRIKNIPFSAPAYDQRKIEEYPPSERDREAEYRNKVVNMARNVYRENGFDIEDYNHNKYMDTGSMHYLRPEWVYQTPVGRPRPAGWPNYNHDRTIEKQLRAGLSNIAGHTVSAYLNIRHPLDIDKDKFRFRKGYALPDDFEVDPPGDFQRAMKNGDEVPAKHLLDAFGAETMNHVVREHGYDGMTHIGGGRMGLSDKEHRVWIAFHPHQIKHVENEGTFNPDDPDMYKALCGERDE